MHDGAARRLDPARIRISLCRRQAGNHSLKNLTGRIETEWCRVTDIELKDAMALGFHVRGPRTDRAANIVEDVAQLIGLHHRPGHDSIVPDSSRMTSRAY